MILNERIHQWVRDRTYIYWWKCGHKLTFI